MFEELPILLKFEVQGNIIKLRLDRFGLGNFELSNQTISEITLQNSNLTENIIEYFQQNIGHVFEYEITKEDDKMNFQFWGDYGRIENEMSIESITEVFSKYTEEDLAQKGNFITTLYVETSEKLLKTSSIHYRLTEKLEFEINNDIEKTRRKVTFYENTDKGKSEAFRSQEKVLQKLLSLLNKPFAD